MSGLEANALQAVVDALPIGVVAFNRTGGIEYVNRVARDLVPAIVDGGSADEVLVVDSAAPRLECHLDGVALEEFESPDPRLRLVALRSSGTEPHGLARYVGVLGHELRNPLAPLRLAAEHLQHGTSDLERTSAIIHRQVAQMARMVDDLLDTARMAQGQMRLSCTPVLLLDVVELALESARPGIAAASHALTLELDGLRGVEVDADGTRLSQAIANLLDNATLFTPTGGSIRVHGWVDGDRCWLRVIDNGQGIDADALESIFDTFAQPQRRNAPSAGLGLGLGLARDIVRLHGGTLTACSDGVGEGASFTLMLPGARTRTWPVVKHNEELPVCAQSVLIVDDNEDAAAMLAIVLEARGVACTVVHSGQAALEAMRTKRFDVAVVDIGLPDIDGLEVARRAGEASHRPARVVALSGYGQPSDRDAAAAAGFDAYFVKPVAPDALSDLLDLKQALFD